MHKQLDCKCSSGSSIYIHEEGRYNGVIDSWNGNGDLQAILICKSIYRVAVLEPSRWQSRSPPGDDLDTVLVVGYKIAI
jgi:hypothetical protein